MLKAYLITFQTRYSLSYCCGYLLRYKARKRWSQFMAFWGQTGISLSVVINVRRCIRQLGRKYCHDDVVRAILLRKISEFPKLSSKISDILANVFVWLYRCLVNEFKIQVYFFVFFLFCLLFFLKIQWRMIFLTLKKNIYILSVHHFVSRGAFDLSICFKMTSI